MIAWVGKSVIAAGLLILFVSFLVTKDDAK